MDPSGWTARLVTGLLLALLLLGPARAEDRPEAERLFALGLDLIAEGDTAGALAAWDGAAATGWTSAALSYNRGVVAFERGDLGAARLALERAGRLAPRDPAVAQALADVRERSGADPPTLARRAARRVGGVLGAGGTVALALALYALTIALAVVWWRRRTRAVGAGAGLAAALAAAAVAVAVSVLSEATAPRGVVLDAGPMRSDPSPTAIEAGALRAGESVDLGRTDGAWRAVTVGDVEGWVPSASVEAI